MHILTVCIGNICRSPLAQALLARELPSTVVWSAGLGALVGHAADPMSVQVGESYGLDLTAHRAQQINGWLCQSAELILVMEQGHKVAIEQQFPLVRGKVFRLCEQDNLDIADPYRQPITACETAYAAIARGVASWAPRIRKLSA